MKQGRCITLILLNVSWKGDDGVIIS